MGDITVGRHYEGVVRKIVLGRMGGEGGPEDNS